MEGLRIDGKLVKIRTVTNERVKQLVLQSREGFVKVSKYTSVGKAFGVVDKPNKVPEVQGEMVMLDMESRVRRVLTC